MIVSRASGVVMLLCLAGGAAAQTAPDIPVRSLVGGPVMGSGHVKELAYSPDGRSLAILTTIGFRVLDAGSGRVVNSIAQPATAVLERYGRFPLWVRELCWSPDGTRIARASGGLEIWEPMGKAPERIFPPEEQDEAFGDLAWSPTGKQIAARSEQGIVLLDIASGGRHRVRARTHRYGLTSHSVQGFSWAPDGRRLAVVAASENGSSETIEIWDSQRLVLVGVIPVGGGTRKDRGVGGRVSGIEVVDDYPAESKVEWSPDGHVLALSSGLSGLSLWDAQTGTLLRRPRQASEVISLSWSRSGELLYVGTDQQIRFLRRADGAPEYVLKNETADEPIRLGAVDETIVCSAVSPDGNHLAAFLAGFNDAEIVLWRGRKRTPNTRIPWNEEVQLVASSLDGRRSVVSVNGKYELRDAESGRPLAVLSRAQHVSWSPDNEVIAAFDGIGQWDLIHALDGRPISSFRASLILHWSPNGEMAAAEVLDGVRLVRAADGELVDSSQAPLRPGRASRGYFPVSWSPNGPDILLERTEEPPSAYRDSVVFSLDDLTLKPAPPGTGPLFWVGPEELVRSSIPRDSNPVQSPDRQFAAAIYEGVKGTRSWRFWHLRTDRVLAGASSEGPPYTSAELVWSPDSKRVAYRAGTEVDVWDVAGGRIVQRWNAPGAVTLQDLAWREKLTVVGAMAGAVRVCREP